MSERKQGRFGRSRGSRRSDQNFFEGKRMINLVNHHYDF